MNEKLPISLDDPPISDLVASAKGQGIIARLAFTGTNQKRTRTRKKNKIVKNPQEKKTIKWKDLLSLIEKKVVRTSSVDSDHHLRSREAINRQSLKTKYTQLLIFNLDHMVSHVTDSAV